MREDLIEERAKLVEEIEKLRNKLLHTDCLNEDEDEFCSYLWELLGVLECSLEDIAEAKECLKRKQCLECC